MKCPMYALALLAFAASMVSAATTRPEAADVDAVDSRPLLKTHPRTPDLPLFSRVLQSLDFRGNDRDEYDLCEGDCDRDQDCADGLVCFQRDGTKSVPGCRGDGVPDVDYCTKDPDLEEDAPSDLGKDFDTLTFIGDNFQGLGKCSGDCDDDDDCQGNLECFKREDDEDVPGCGDGSDGSDGADYCYDPDDAVVVQEEIVVVPPVASTTKPTNMPSKSPTTAKPSSPAPTSLPTAKAVEETDSPTSDPTLEPTKEPTEDAVPKPTAPLDDWWGPKDPVAGENSAPTKEPIDFEPEDIGVSVPPFVVDGS
mmetsp:Transcript_27316/g.63952  ORF Transcript_27316/g.63952 Transcript_27316/m.63952 type:complete len:309 (-) Transcript_27316:399-1325(-)